MGAVRHRQLILGLSIVVALEMAVGVVTLAVRTQDGRVHSALFAGSVQPHSRNDGALAGGNFSNRRGSTATSTTRANGAPATTATTRAPAGTAPPPTTGPAATTPTTSAPGTTATTQRTPETTATTRPAPAGTSSSSARPGAGAAPPATTATSGPAAAGKGHSNVQTDPIGDTFVDGTHAPVKEDKADIVRAAAAYEAGTISLAMQVAQPVDPSKDAKWASDSTFADWSIDTNGDGTPDFDVQYSFADGEIGGTVSRPGSQDTVCDADKAGYSPDGYWLTVPASCLGDPASFSYRVTMYYDLNPKDANADVASDVAPNGGMSFPVSRPN